MLLSSAIGQNIRSYCIFDSDFHTPTQIAARKTDAREKGLDLHIWQRKELENYLLVPAVIRRVITKRVKGGKQVPTAEELTEKLFSLAGELEHEVMDAFAAEFQFENRAGGATVANRSARERMRVLWSTIDGRLSLVSGKLVLAGLSEWLQNNYGVSISTASIAREMHLSELPAEIATVLTSIEYGDPFQLDGE